MTPTAYLGLYCLVIVAASLVGGWVPLHLTLTHKRIQLANSLIGGFMLGVALLSLLPHALISGNDPAVLMLWLVAGVMTMFLLERFFHFHQHDLPSHPPSAHAPGGGHTHAHHDHDHDHGPGCEHDPAPVTVEDCDDDSTQAPHYDRNPKLSWSGAAVGLVLHSLIAGIGLGAAMTADHDVAWPGLALFLVIVMHKPFDAMTLLALVATSGWSRKAGHLINAVFALVVPLGAGIFLLEFADEHAGHSALVGNALAFSAGVFLCVALSDLLPELHFHQHDKVKLTAALIVGLALAWTINYFEMKQHDHGHDHGPVPHDHDGDGVPDH
ncbi:MAG: ZIP family metal transporter [Phycisphaeraceae bacterium]